MPQPSEAEWQMLVEKFREQCAALRTATDDLQRLEITTAYMRTAMHYFLSADEVKHEHLTRPFGYLHIALHNAGQGANVPLLDHKPESAKPAGTMREIVQAHLAYALELQTRSGRGTNIAAEEVAKLCRGRIGTEDGGDISATQIKAWRSDIRRKRASATTMNEFQRLGDLYKALVNSPKSDLKLKRARETSNNADVGYGLAAAAQS